MITFIESYLLMGLCAAVASLYIRLWEGQTKKFGPALAGFIFNILTWPLIPVFLIFFKGDDNAHH